MKDHIFEVRRKIYSKDMTDQCSYTNNLSIVVKLKLEKYSGLNEIRTHGLYVTSTVLYQLSYQANWVSATL